MCLIYFELLGGHVYLNLVLTHLLQANIALSKYYCLRKVFATTKQGQWPNIQPFLLRHEYMSVHAGLDQKYQLKSYS